MQPPLILLSMLATFLSLVSGLPLPLKQLDDDDDISVSLDPIRIGLGGTLAARSAEPSIADDENAIKQRDDDDDISVSLGPIRVGLGGTLAARSAEPSIADDENAIKQRDDDDDITVSLGPIRVGATTGLLAVRSAEPPIAFAEDMNALKQRDNNDPSSQPVALLRRQTQDPSGILKQVLHFPTDVWAAAADVLERLPGRS